MTPSACMPGSDMTSGGVLTNTITEIINSTEVADGGNKRKRSDGSDNGKEEICGEKTTCGEENVEGDANATKERKPWAIFSFRPIIS